MWLDLFEYGGWMTQIMGEKRKIAKLFNFEFFF